MLPKTLNHIPGKSVLCGVAQCSLGILALPAVPRQQCGSDPPQQVPFRPLTCHKMEAATLAEVLKNKVRTYVSRAASAVLHSALNWTALPDSVRLGTEQRSQQLLGRDREAGRLRTNTVLGSGRCFWGVRSSIRGERNSGSWVNRSSTGKQKLRGHRRRCGSLTYYGHFVRMSSRQLECEATAGRNPTT